MFQRISILAGISCLALLVGCSSPAPTSTVAVGSDQTVLSHHDRLSDDDDDDDVDVMTLELASYDGSTGTVSGTVRGRSVQVQLATTTFVRKASFGEAVPDPIKELFIAWNDLIAATPAPVTFGTL